MNLDRLVLVLDIGSTWCKAALIDPAGMIAGEGARWVRDDRPFGHDADALARLWRAAREAINDAQRQIDGDGRPAAVAVATRKAPGIWLDRHGRPLGLPPEATAGAGREDIEECYASPAWGDDDPFAYGYGIDLIGNTRWLRKHHPSVWSRVEYAGNLQSWVLLQLTGRWITSRASGPVQDIWPAAVLPLSGLPASAYPAVEPDSQIVGTLRPEAGRDLGIPAGTPVVTGTHDGAAASIGAGALETGDACLTLGTNGVLRVVTGHRLPGRFGYIVTDRRWALVRDLPDLSRHLDGVVSTLDKSAVSITPGRHEELTSLAAAIPIGSQGLLLRLIPASAGVSAGEAAALGYSPAAIYRAALEAVGFGFTGLVRQAQLSGARPSRFVATGGATGNRLLMRIISACIGAPIAISRSEAGLLGLAALAYTGIGTFRNVPEATKSMRIEMDTIEASDAEQRAYANIIEATPLPSGTAPGDRVASGRYAP